MTGKKWLLSRAKIVVYIVKCKIDEWTQNGLNM